MDSFANSIEKIKKAYEIQDFLVGNITHISNNYLIVKIFDYPCIMEKEEVEVFNVRNYKLYQNKDIVVKVTSIKYNCLNSIDIRVSHRAVAEEILAANKIECFENVRKNFRYKGIVKDIKDYGKEKL